jgi:hypothetical protein
MSVPIVDNLTVNGIATLNGSNGLLTLNSTFGDYYQLNFANVGSDIWRIGPYYPDSNNFLFYSTIAGNNLLDIDVTTGMLLINQSNLGEKINMYETGVGYSVGVENSNFKFVMGNGATDSITFNQGPYASSTEVMRIQADGKTGIGTDAPAEKLSVVGNISASGTITVLNGNSNRWNSNWTTTNSNSANWSSVYTSFNSNSAKYDSNYTTTNSNSAAWSNWGSVSANYALGSQYVKLSGDDMTGLLTNSVGISSFSLSARFIDLVHLPANDGTNPVLRIGEYDTASGNQGFSGMYMSYDETTNAFGISAQFSPAAAVPALSIDRNANVGVRSFVAGPAFNSFSLSAPISAVSGLYVDPVAGYAGLYNNIPVAPLDVRGNMVSAAFVSSGLTSPYSIKIQGNYAYVADYGASGLLVYDLTRTTPVFAASASAATQPAGVFVSGKYAYVVTSNSSSSVLQIFNITTTTPQWISTTSIGVGAFNANEIVVQGNYAFIMCPPTSLANPYLVAFDVSNPYAPSKIYAFQPASSVSSYGMYIQGNYLYWSSGSLGTARFQRIDITDVRKGVPVVELVFGSGGAMYGCAVRGKYAYVNFNSNLGVIDITTGTLAAFITIRTTSAASNISTVVLQGNYAYVTTTNWINKVDVSNPLSPILVQALAITNTSGNNSAFVIQGRYCYLLAVAPARIIVYDLGGAYVSQLQAGGTLTDTLDVSRNTVIGGDFDVAGGAAFGQGFRSYKDSSILGSLYLTTLSSSSASNYFSVVSGNNNTIFTVASTGNVGIGTSFAGSKLTVVGDISATGNITGGVLTVTNLANISGVVTLGNSSNVSTLQINGYANKGGTGYHDFASVTNTYGSATTPSKFFRLNSSGGLEIINSAYTANLLQITNDGAINVYGANAAVVSNNDALSGYIGFNNNNSQIYDDGNTHIHSRGSGNAMWINTNNGQLNLLVQSPVSGGSVGTGVAIGTGTLNGYVSINSSRNTAITQPYGYLISSGAGSTTGTSPNPYSLTCSSRIQCPEFDASSDERLKENIVPISLKDALNFVKGVSAVTFNWKDKENPGKKSGYIAQQVMRSGFDHMISVVGNSDLQEKIDADGFVSPASAALVMNYDQAIPYHSTVIKNLLGRIEQLELEIKNLKK